MSLSLETGSKYIQLPPKYLLNSRNGEVLGSMKLDVRRAIPALRWHGIKDHMPFASFTTSMPERERERAKDFKKCHFSS